MYNWKKLKSREDASVNFVCDHPAGGKLEARFVQRSPDYFIVYLSSHTGCTKACRFCHLTTTGQTAFHHVTISEYAEQAATVLKYFDGLHFEQKPTRVNFNWMARGEPLANNCMLDITHNCVVFGLLENMAEQRNLVPHFNISTIMPVEVRYYKLTEIFGDAPINFYYSLYSAEYQFRRRWLPKALPFIEALDKLKEYQKETGCEITLHWAFIEGENDSVDSVERILEQITKRDIHAKFNLVRYNPPNNKSRESSSDVLERNFKIIANALKNEKSKIVPRVGFDVKASCGMFISE